VRSSPTHLVAWGELAFRTTAARPGTEFVSFSRSEELRTNEAVMFKNMQEMQGRSTP
jgi:hypothetical protein